jgi:hypothetical protein
LIYKGFGSLGLRDYYTGAPKPGQLEEWNRFLTLPIAPQ